MLGRLAHCPEGSRGVRRAKRSAFASHSPACHTFSMSTVNPSRTRDLLELILGYGTIVGVIWTPEHLQRILSPFALALTLLVVLLRRQSRDELGLGWRGF